MMILHTPYFLTIAPENGWLVQRENGTPPKTNMEPENESLEEEIPTNNHHFPIPC